MPVTHRRLTVIAILLSVFMSAMEGTVVATAMPTVIADLGGVALYGWVSSSYLLTMTVTVPLYGKLADLYGRKRVMSVAIVLFIAGSVACGLAPSVEVLILARAMQGLGAGGIQPVAITLVGDLFALEERSKVQGLFGALWGGAAILGPLLGGLIVHNFDWRWVFWINVPFGLASLSLLRRALHEAPRPPSTAPLDLAGALLLVSASSAMLLGAGGTSPPAMAVAAVVLLALYARVERRAADPVLPPSSLRDRQVAVASSAGAATGVVMMGTLVYMPLYAQGVLGLGPTEAGSTVATMLIGWPIASTLTSRFITRVGFRAPLWLGSALVLLAMLLLVYSVYGRHGPGALRAEMFVLGMGMGLVTTALILALQSSVDYERRGVATSTNMFARSIGGVLGVAGLGAVLASGLRARLDPERVAQLLDLEHRAAGLPPDPEAMRALGEVFGPLVLVIAAAAVLNACVVGFYPRRHAP